MQNRISRLLLVAALFIGAPLPTSAQDAQGIAAIVNDDLVTVYDLESRIRMVVESTGMRKTAEVARRLVPQVLRSLIDEKLKIQEARALEIDITEADIDDALLPIAQRNKQATVEAMMKDLERRGVPGFTLRDQIAASLAWSQAISKRAAGRITVSKNEVEQELQRIKRSYNQKAYRLFEIFLSTGAPGETDAGQLATRLHQQLTSGGNFPAIARQFSQSASASAGGDLGWVTTGQLDGTVAAAVGRMQAGQLSAPITVRGGYYIVALRDIGTGARTLGAATAGVSVRQLVFPFLASATSQQRQQTLTAARGNSRDLTSCQALVQRGQALRGVHSASLGAAGVAALPDRVRQLIANLPAGKPSDPVVTTSGATVFMVCARKSNLPSDTAMRKRIENKMSDEKLNLFARHRLQGLRRSAFVDIKL